MESILARALEYTLKYWLKSFSRDQFKLQGRTVQLSNLDINGDALHASIGLPPALNVATAKVGKLEIMLPSVSNVQIEPIVVRIDKLDLVLEETDDLDASSSSSSAQSSPSSGKGSGYGFADKIADGMTVEVHTVNILIETHGGARHKGGATWALPMASLTIRNVLLFTTNESWQAVNLKEARDFSNNRKFIYVFKKLEWESLSIDLLPHPDMFSDAHFASAQDGSNKKDDDGAKRVFFGGERFVEGISGQAYITVQRTELNSPLGLEVQLHITEVVCPALSEPGNRTFPGNLVGFLKAFANRQLILPAEFRLELLMQSLFFSRKLPPSRIKAIEDSEQNKVLSKLQIRVSNGIPACPAWIDCSCWQEREMDRGVSSSSAPKASKIAGLDLLTVITQRVYLLTNGARQQAEIRIGSLKASVSDGENGRCLTQVRIGGLFLRDTFSHPPSTLVQPSMQAAAENFLHTPEFGKSFCPPIYPLGDQPWQLNVGVPLICLHEIQVQPSPAPPSFASQTVVDCQPLMIHLQEESCLKIVSLLVDGIMVNPGAVLPDFSVNSIKFNLKGLDITVPVDMENPIDSVASRKPNFRSCFAGARLHIENLFFSESPSLSLKLLNLEKDPACFCLWEDQPVDASQKKWCTGASLLSLSLETCDDATGLQSSPNSSSGLWKCVELKDACVEVAMATADGSTLIIVPPPGGLVRVGVTCEQFFSNTSVEQLFFVLDLYAYFGSVGEKLAIIRKSNQMKRTRDEGLGGRIIEKVPSDTAVSLAVKLLRLRFLESSLAEIQGMPLVQFLGENLFVKVTHRTLGGAIAISSSLCWESVEVDCADTEGNLSHENGVPLTAFENGHLMVGNGRPQLRTVFWVQKRLKLRSHGNTSSVPFLDIRMVHVIPYSTRDMECHSLSLSACIAGVRLGGGMNYAEALLHRFGILGPDGGPGEGLSKGLENLSAGPLSKLFKASPLIPDDLQENMNNGTSGDGNDNVLLHLGTPDDVDLTIELKDWLFALEGAQNNTEGQWLHNDEGLGREERCWHTTFEKLQMKAKSSPKHVVTVKEKSHRLHNYPVELVTVGVEGLQILKPQAQKCILWDGLPLEGPKEAVHSSGGINLESSMVISQDDVNLEMVKWMVENFKFSVSQPIEAVVTKDELQHLAFLCKSEVDSMGRIAAGVLRVLKLEGSIGEAAINQLSNLGSEGFDKIFVPEKLSRGSCVGSNGCTPPSNTTGESTYSSTMESTVVSLEELVADSQSKCAALTAGLCNSESSIQHLAEIEQLTQKLESMQSLLTRLRTRI
ncbi:hypothetical protein RHMOL_Rhmol06G0290500 [Rhododendron molle]|uniref:Uncharacterized protein n=1 Tax=Rhododendron molle TaxID=49168 RepID=A0ACC0NHB2_RHOML|nr:hypothetical protein RHMOL_Rhmol06G0290500 [Rhododendron molle]